MCDCCYVKLGRSHWAVVAIQLSRDRLWGSVKKGQALSVLVIIVIKKLH